MKYPIGSEVQISNQKGKAKGIVIAYDNDSELYGVDYLFKIRGGKNNSILFQEQRFGWFPESDLKINQ